MSAWGYLKSIFAPEPFHHPDGWAYHRLPSGPPIPNPAAQAKPRLAAVRSAP
jgi:hypothetical protein